MPSTTDFISTVAASSGIDQWVTATPYVLDQYVEEGTKLYRCTLAHTSSALFTTDSANWVEVSPSSPIATLLDSSAGAVTETLPAATGSGATRKYVVADKTNIITFAVATGEFLNEVVDDTYRASNHAVGTEFDLVDYATGKWSLQVVGASTEVSLARYSVRGAVDNVSLVGGPNILPIGSLLTSDLASSGQLIAGEHDPLSWRVANEITVSKTGRYRVDLNVVHTAQPLVGGNTQETASTDRAGVRINGTSIEWIGIDDSTGLADQMSGFIVRQFTAGDQVVVVANATGTTANEDFYVSFAMEELPSTETILAGHVVPTPLTYAYLRRDINGATSNSLNFQAVTVSGTADTTTIPTTARRMVLSSPMASSLSGVSVASDQLVVSATGRYEVVAHVDFVATQTVLTGRNTFLVVKNGAAILDASIITSDNNGIGYQVSHLWEGDLTAGDVIDFRGDGQVNFGYRAYSVQLRQLPSSTVVNPDLVPVTNLTSANIAAIAGNGNAVLATLTSTTAAANNPHNLMLSSARIPLTSAGWANVDLSDSRSSGITVGTHTLTIEEDGRYDISASATHLGPSGASTAAAVQVVRNGTTVLAVNAGYSGPSGRLPITTVYTGPLVAGDTIDVRVANQESASVSVEGFAVNVQQISEKSITYLSPAFTEAKDLHWISLSCTGVGTNNDVGTKGGLVELSDAQVTRRDPHSMLVTNVAGDYIEIKQAGRYTFNSTITTSSAANVNLTVNGAVVATSVSTTANDTSSLNYTNNFVVGDQIRLECTSTSGRLSLALNQEPSSEYVTPGDVPVEDVEVLLGSGAGPTGTISMPWNQLQAAGYSHVRVFVGESVTSGSNNRFAVGNVVPTSYLTGSAGGTSRYLAYAYADATNYIHLHMTDETTANIQLGGLGIGTNPVWEVYGIKPQKTVINTTDVPVNDQATSGYFDIGTMRLAWGSTTTTPAGTLAMTLPGGGFANTGYAFTPSSVLEGFDARETVPAKTATIVNVKTLNANTTTVAGNVPFTWFAIGQKP